MSYAAVIGTFDGLHRGHQRLLEQLREVAKARGLQSMAVTFTEHPMAHIPPFAVPPRLCDNARRIRLLEQSVDKVVVLDFSTIKHLTAAQFMERLAALGVTVLLMGYDTRFGSDMPREAEVYRTAASAAGITVVFCSTAVHTDDGAVIASSSIRKALADGDVATAALMLGRPYAVTGTVDAGRGQGRTIGFPTANVRPDDPEVAVPAPGVYACVADAVSANGSTIFRDRPAMVNIGTCPTFVPDGRKITIEAHIPGFAGDLYGATLSLRFVRRMRSERAFPSVEALKAQLHSDAAKTLEILKQAGLGNPH